MTDAEKLLVCTNALSTACDALGDIMQVLTARRLLSVERVLTAPMREHLTKNAIDDAALEQSVAAAFEAAVVVMVKLGVPGAMIHTCTTDDMEIL